MGGYLGLKAIKLGLLLFAVLLNPAARGADIDDVEVEAEEVMSDGEAAADVVRTRKLHLEQEQKEARESGREAVRMKAQAAAKRRAAEPEIGALGSKIRAASSRKEQALREKATNEKIIADLEKKLAEKKAALDKAKGEAEAAKEFVAEQRMKISALKKDITSATADTARLQKDIQEYNRQKKIAATEQALLEARMKHARVKFKRTKEVSHQAEHSAEQQKRSTRNARENLDWAKGQVERKRQPKATRRQAHNENGDMR